MGKGGGIGVAAARVWVSLGWWGGGGGRGEADCVWRLSNYLLYNLCLLLLVLHGNYVYVRIHVFTVRHCSPDTHA